MVEPTDDFTTVPSPWRASTEFKQQRDYRLSDDINGIFETYADSIAAEVQSIQDAVGDLSTIIAELESYYGEGDDALLDSVTTDELSLPVVPNVLLQSDGYMDIRTAEGTTSVPARLRPFHYEVPVQFVDSGKTFPLDASVVSEISQPWNGTTGTGNGVKNSQGNEGALMLNTTVSTLNDPVLYMGWAIMSTAVRDRWTIAEDSSILNYTSSDISGGAVPQYTITFRSSSDDISFSIRDDTGTGTALFEWDKNNVENPGSPYDYTLPVVYYVPATRKVWFGYYLNGAAYWYNGATTADILAGLNASYTMPEPMEVFIAHNATVIGQSRTTRIPEAPPNNPFAALPGAQLVAIPS